MTKKVWVVSDNLYDEDEYGAEMYILGIYDNKEDVSNVLKNYDIKEPFDNIPMITEVEINKPCERYIGGYIE